MDKDCIRSTLISLSEDELRHATEHYQRFFQGTKLDPNEPIENDEQAQAVFQRGLAEGLEQPLHAADIKLKKLREIDFSSKDEVEEGALICIDDRHFVISVATDRFKCEGTEIMGISTEAPLYQALEGKVEGEMCTFRGREFTISKIF